MPGMTTTRLTYTESEYSWHSGELQIPNGKGSEKIVLANYIASNLTLDRPTDIWYQKMISNQYVEMQHVETRN